MAVDGRREVGDAHGRELDGRKAARRREARVRAQEAAVEGRDGHGFGDLLECLDAQLEVGPERDHLADREPALALEVRVLLLHVADVGRRAREDGALGRVDVDAEQGPQAVDLLRDLVVVEDAGEGVGVALLELVVEPERRLVDDVALDVERHRVAEHEAHVGHERVHRVVARRELGLDRAEVHGRGDDRRVLVDAHALRVHGLEEPLGLLRPHEVLEHVAAGREARAADGRLRRRRRRLVDGHGVGRRGRGRLGVVVVVAAGRVRGLRVARGADALEPRLGLVVAELGRAGVVVVRGAPVRVDAVAAVLERLGREEHADEVARVRRGAPGCDGGGEVDVEAQQAVAAAEAEHVVAPAVAVRRHLEERRAALGEVDLELRDAVDLLRVLRRVLVDGRREAQAHERLDVAVVRGLEPELRVLLVAADVHGVVAAPEHGGRELREVRLRVDGHGVGLGRLRRGRLRRGRLRRGRLRRGRLRGVAVRGVAVRGVAVPLRVGVAREVVLGAGPLQRRVGLRAGGSGAGSGAGCGGRRAPRRPSFGRTAFLLVFNNTHLRCL